MQNVSAENRIADYSDFVNGQHHTGLATTTGGDSRQMMKGVKVTNENGVRKINQRSQSVLKSHMEFNHNFVNN